MHETCVTSMHKNFAIFTKTESEYTEQYTNIAITQLRQDRAVLEGRKISTIRTKVPHDALAHTISLLAMFIRKIESD
jgi:hypothetical protein